MGVYHITYTPELREICLYYNGGCSFSCHGCITDWHPKDCHLDEETGQIKNRTLDIEEVLSYLQPLTFKKVIFLGKEPTVDSDFLPLAKTLKKHFSTYNILLTNAWEYVEDEAMDEVCVSIKAITPWVFKDFTGKSDPERVLKNFKTYISQYIKMYSLKSGKQALLGLHFYPLFQSMIDITPFLAIRDCTYFSPSRSGVFRS